ncbi:MAG: T9SS type A sorting domain-containing protein [Bacteroidales bacterium]|nr:T9SS type A sorting domain-containing protein [Bacteroidales bacterium]
MKQSIKITSITILFLLFRYLSLNATIITVKQDGTGNYLTIQEGINASSNSDTVLVYQGTYFENIDFNGKCINLASLYLTTQDESYIHNTIIDGNQNGSCVLIKSGEDENTVLCGFTILNGSGYGTYYTGGGIYVKNSKPRINNCIIKNNSAVQGGGIYCKNTNIFLKGSNINNNHATDAAGGIALADNSTIEFDTMDKCNIFLNYAGKGSDFMKSYSCPPTNLIIDTFTVLQPDNHFIYSADYLGYPVNDITTDILHAKIEPVNANIYVSPDGNNNSGLTPDDPLKSVTFAYIKIYPDSLNPNTIYLTSGTYSPSNTGEKYPVNQRSYVSLIGDSIENTILDAESLSSLFQCNHLNNNYSIKNLMLKTGFGNQSPIGGIAGFKIIDNDNVIIKNFILKNCEGSDRSGISSTYSNIMLKNVCINNNIGGTALSLSNTQEPAKTFHIENCIIKNNLPGQNYDAGEGRGLGIAGRLSPVYTYEGKIVNLQVTGNLTSPDPIWGAGLLCNHVYGHAKVDFINATFGNNILRGESGASIGGDEGAIINIYNSIFYGDSLYEISMGSSQGSTSSATVSITHSCVEGGEENIQNWYNQHTINWLSNNIDEDPLWENTGDFPYALTENSPCINAGTPMYEPGMQPPYIFQEDTIYYLVTLDNDTIQLPATDLAGNPRISGERIDMGAYEFQDTNTRIQNLPQEESKYIKVYPNPFWYNTFISFKLGTEGHVIVNNYNLQGKKVKKQMDAKTTTGKFTMTWDGKDDKSNNLKPGTYILNIILNNKVMASVKIVKNKIR